MRKLGGYLRKTLGAGGPVNKAWLTYSGIGCVIFGLFSIPSTGYSICLIPMFILAGLIILIGSFLSRQIVIFGLALMTLTSWFRGVVLWNLEQDGAGSVVLASLVWSWITIGSVMLLVSVWIRGIQGVNNDHRF